MYAEHLIVVPLHGTLHGLNNARNSSIVWVHFILEDEVHSNCDSFKSSQGRDDCISDIGHLPYTVLSLISDGAKEFQVAHSSGLWDKWRWGSQRDAIHELKTPLFLPAAGAALFVDVGASSQLDHALFERTKAGAVGLLNVPITTSESFPFPLLCSGCGVGNVTACDRMCLAQTFPFAKYSIADQLTDLTALLPCKDKAGLASLLSPELFHTSPWASISLHSWNDGCAGAAVVKCESNTNSPHSQCDCNRGGVYSHAVGVALDIFFIIDAAEAAALSTKAQSQLLSAAGTAEGDRAAVSGSSCRIPPDAWRNTSTYRFNQASNYKVEYSHAGHSHVTSFRVDATRVAFDSRALEFAVETEYRFTFECAAASRCISHPTDGDRYFMHISEVAGDSYDIMWNSFTYETLLRDGECHQFGTPLSIFQLDEISWTGSDCGASGSSSGSSYGSAYQQPYSCARTVHFAIPFNTSGVDIIRTRYTARKRFVSRDKQPIDASRGAVVPSSASHIMRCTIDAPCSAFSSIVITEPLLVLSPIPDMSMPYNVITLVSTLVAFFVGTFINALFKRRESNS